MFPAASGVAAKPPPTAEPLAAEPPTAAEPLSLLRRLRFEGLAFGSSPKEVECQAKCQLEREVNDQVIMSKKLKEKVEKLSS